MSANAVVYESQGNFWSFDGQRYFHPEAAFSRDNRLRSRSANTLYVNEPDFKRDRQILDVQAVGAIVAFAMQEGITWIRFQRCSVSVNYLIKALQFRGKHGWFWDCLDTTADHAFDANSPTPGGYWGEAQQLYERANELDTEAGLYRAAWRSTEADQLESEADGLRKRARRLRFTGAAD